jgi:hypothetical protein
MGRGSRHQPHAPSSLARRHGSRKSRAPRQRDHGDQRTRQTHLDRLAARGLELVEVYQPLGQYALIVDEALYLYDSCDSLLAELADRDRPHEAEHEIIDLDSGRSLDASFLVSLRLALQQ